MSDSSEMRGDGAIWKTTATVQASSNEQSKQAAMAAWTRQWREGMSAEKDWGRTG